MRLVQSAKATMEDRGAALAAAQAARGDVAHKRSKLTKLRGTPGIRVRIVQLHDSLSSQGITSWGRWQNGSGDHFGSAPSTASCAMLLSWVICMIVAC